MQEFGKFLVTNWQSILSITISVIVFIIALVKKKPIAADYLQLAQKVVCQFVNTAILTAESKSDELSGEGKKEVAMDYLWKRLSNILDLDSLTELQTDRVSNLFSSKIEETLSTPRKKN